MRRGEDKIYPGNEQTTMSPDKTSFSKTSGIIVKDANMFLLKVTKGKIYRGKFANR